MNEILEEPSFLSKIRELTLRPCYGIVSGMNHELNELQSIKNERPVRAKAALAYLNDELVGWGLCSQEPSNYGFTSGAKFLGNGILFQVFVSSFARKLGIASALFHKAGEFFTNEKFYVCPWNEASYKFYEKHTHISHELI